jgi:hypothetical protein
MFGLNKGIREEGFLIDEGGRGNNFLFVNGVIVEIF